MKKFVYFLLVLIVLLVLVYWVLNLNREEIQVRGWVKYSSPSAQTITIEKEEGGEFNLVLTSKTKFYDEKDKKTDFDYFLVGTKVEAEGLDSGLKEESLVVKKVKVLVPTEPELYQES